MGNFNICPPPRHDVHKRILSILSRFVSALRLEISSQQILDMGAVGTRLGLLVLSVAALLCCELRAVCGATEFEAAARSYAQLTRSQVHSTLDSLYRQGRYVELERVASTIIQQNPTVIQNSNYTSVFEFIGVAQYSLGELDKAITTFRRGVDLNEDDIMAWVHLGNCYLYKLELAKSIEALEVAVVGKGATAHLHQLVKARNWIANWQNREESMAQVDEQVREDLMRGLVPTVTPLDFVELDSITIKQIANRSYHYFGLNRLCCDDQTHSVQLRSPKLRVGFVSSDFGVHPVVTLMRGILEILAHSRNQEFTVYGFSLTAATSWWKRNITRSVDHMISLLGKNPAEAAKAIHSHNIHVLIDLNGHTLHSGLSIFSYRPARVQMSFLGYPMTTGNPNIDFFIADPVTTPPEIIDSLFTEKMLLLPTHYIVNDHMQMMGHTIQGDRPTLKEVVSHFQPSTDDVFVFATFSNWQKMDPFIFSAWMAIMGRVPNSVMWFIRSKGHVEAEKNLRAEACGHGIDCNRRLLFSDYQPWLHHTHGKRAADLILDTSLKNGHTTVLDALFAGVPVITIEGNRMSNRAASSALHSLRIHELPANSIKEYVELAVALASDRSLLSRLRATTEQHRLVYPLFDTHLFTNRFGSALRCAWHLRRGVGAEMHLFSPIQDESRMVPRFIQAETALGDDETEDPYESQVQQALLARHRIMLHVGGQVRRDGWWVVNIEDRVEVDFILPMDKLYPFPDGSVDEIYASHVLEHVHFGVDEDVRHTLDEWYRVLKPSGSLLVAVPDMAILSSLFINETLTDQERFFVMRMFHGGQVNAYDVHKVGFNFHILRSFLQNAGFCEIKRVDSFGLFSDASTAQFRGVPISLNVVARACKSW